MRASKHPLIRRLATDDIERIMAIEQAAYPFPWTRGVFSDCLDSAYACFGLQLGKDLAGYSIFNWTGGEAHLLNLCVHPDWQHRGLGSLLLEYTIKHVTRRQNEALFLEVRSSNPKAVKLYGNRGFATIGRRPGYYRADEGREDAIVMRLELQPKTVMPA